MKRVFLIVFMVVITAALFAQVSGEVGIETDFETSTIATADLSASVSDAVTADISFTTTDWDVGISEFTITGTAGPVGIKFGYFDDYTEGAVKVDATYDIVSANFTTDFDFENMAAEVTVAPGTVSITADYAGAYTEHGAGSVGVEWIYEPVTMDATMLYTADSITWEAGAGVTLFGATLSTDFAIDGDTFTADVGAEYVVVGITLTADVTDNFDVYAVGAEYTFEGITYNVSYADGILFGISAAF